MISKKLRTKNVSKELWERVVIKLFQQTTKQKLNFYESNCLCYTSQKASYTVRAVPPERVYIFIKVLIAKKLFLVEETTESKELTEETKAFLSKLIYWLNPELTNMEYLANLVETDAQQKERVKNF